MLLRLVSISTLISCVLASSVFAQSDKDDGEVVPRPVDQKYEEGWTEVKKFTDAERKEICKQYEGKFIGYYQRLYKIKNCQRRSVTRNKELMSRTPVNVLVVEPEVIAALPMGPPLDSKEASHRRSCKELEGHYVTFTFTSIYLVQKCVLKEFPDWETFQDHRKKNNRLRKPVLALKSNEFFSMKRSDRPLASVIDKVYASVLTGEAGVDVIPLDEACEGIEGKDVYFYSKIYRIQSCRKREYDPEYYVRKKDGEVKLIELSSSQWLSLPDGEPMAKSKNK